MRRWFRNVEPSAWLTRNLDLLPASGDALDVACGRGRNALALGRAGLRVRAVDRDERALRALRVEAGRLDLPVVVEAVDLEASEPDLGTGAYDVVAVFNYLHRPLFPALLRALRPAGLLIYETFIVDQAARGRPTNPLFLLQRGELKRLVAPLQVVREREGDFDGAMVAGVVARRA
jgi:SAM-dependent methyltransferase